MLSPEVQASATRSVLCWLATVDEVGQPNVSPKEIFSVFDASHLVIANIASPTSVRNVGVNPRVCVTFVDVFVQKGFKVTGSARNVRKNDPEYSRWAAPLLAKAGPRFPIHSVLVVQAVAVEPVLAPSYRLYAAETTEESQVASAMRTYGVRSERDERDRSDLAAECYQRLADSIERPSDMDGAIDVNRGGNDLCEMRGPRTSCRRPALGSVHRPQMRTVVVPRCSLEPQVQAHARELFAVLSDPAIYEFENSPPPSEAWLAARFARLESRASADGSEQWLNWVVRLPEGVLAGYVQATVRRTGTALIAYELGSRHWRQGIGSAAVAAMLAELETHHGVHEFIAVLKARNYRSLALLKSLGFRQGDPQQAAAVDAEPDELLMVKAVA